MSLEEALNKNTAAMERHNELLEKILSGAAKTADTAIANTKTTTPATQTEPAAAPARGRRAAVAAAPKAPTVAVVSENTKKFLEVDNQDEYEARRAFVKKLVAKFGVEKMSLLAEADRQPALDMLTAFAAGDDPGVDDTTDDDDLT